MIVQYFASQLFSVLSQNPRGPGPLLNPDESRIVGALVGHLSSLGLQVEIVVTWMSSGNRRLRFQVLITGSIGRSRAAAYSLIRSNQG